LRACRPVLSVFWKKNWKMEGLSQEAISGNLARNSCILLLSRACKKRAGSGAQPRRFFCCFCCPRADFQHYCFAGLVSLRASLRSVGVLGLGLWAKLAQVAGSVGDFGARSSCSDATLLLSWGHEVAGWWAAASSRLSRGGKEVGRWSRT
jgi:hypothetical protein